MDREPMEEIRKNSIFGINQMHDRIKEQDQEIRDLNGHLELKTQHVDALKAQATELNKTIDRRTKVIEELVKIITDNELLELNEINLKYNLNIERR